jgi:hypothetical protein
MASETKMSMRCHRGAMMTGFNRAQESAIYLKSAKSDCGWKPPISSRRPMSAISECCHSKPDGPADGFLLQDVERNRCRHAVLRCG